LDIFKTLKQIRDSEGLTILLVEQNVQHCLNLADRGYVLENGETVMEGKGQDLLHDPHLKEHYLGL
ncbi:MAG: ABC transporter ATP-binding protein, partial [Carboxydocellales bacterium]